MENTHLKSIQMKQHFLNLFSSTDDPVQRRAYSKSDDAFREVLQSSKVLQKDILLTSSSVLIVDITKRNLLKNSGKKWIPRTVLPEFQFKTDCERLNSFHQRGVLLENQLQLLSGKNLNSSNKALVGKIIVGKEGCTKHTIFSDLNEFKAFHMAMV